MGWFSKLFGWSPEQQFEKAADALAERVEETDKALRVYADAYASCHRRIWLSMMRGMPGADPKSADQAGQAERQKISNGVAPLHESWKRVEKILKSIREGQRGWRKKDAEAFKELKATVKTVRTFLRKFSESYKQHVADDLAVVNAELDALSAIIQDCRKKASDLHEDET